jgi:hypothetical protein
MEYVFGIAGILPLVLGLLRKGKRSISEMNRLLQDESYMEKLVSGLKKLLDGFKGASFHEDIPELNKELYVLLEEKCTNLYDEMRRIKETFQRQTIVGVILFASFQLPVRKLGNCIDCSLSLIPLSRLLFCSKTHCSSRGSSTFIPHRPLSFLFCFH